MGSLGPERFLERLEHWLVKAVAGKRRESHIGGRRESHDERAAERLLGTSMRVLGIEEADLRELPLGCPEKVVLAWWLRERTTVSLRWVANRLKMGHYTRVTQAVARVGRQPAKGLAPLCRQLEREVEHA